MCIRRVPPTVKVTAMFDCSQNKWDTRYMQAGCKMAQVAAPTVVHMVSPACTLLQEMPTAEIQKILCAKASVFRAVQRQLQGQQLQGAPKKATAAPQVKYSRLDKRKLGWCVTPACKDAIGPHEGGGMVKCTKCKDSMHAHCLIPILDLDEVDASTWLCPECDDKCMLCARGGMLIACDRCAQWVHWNCNCQESGTDSSQPPPTSDHETFECYLCSNGSSKAAPRKRPRPAGVPMVAVQLATQESHKIQQLSQENHRLQTKLERANQRIEQLERARTAPDGGQVAAAAADSGTSVDAEIEQMCEALFARHESAQRYIDLFRGEEINFDELGALSKEDFKDLGIKVNVALQSCPLYTARNCTTPLSACPA